MAHPEIELAAANAARAVVEGSKTVNDHIQTYIEDYEFRGDSGDHTPTEDERVLIADAIAGLLADDVFLKAFLRLLEQRKLLASLHPMVRQAADAAAAQPSADRSAEADAPTGAEPSEYRHAIDECLGEEAASLIASLNKGNAHMKGMAEMTPDETDRAAFERLYRQGVIVTQLTRLVYLSCKATGRSIASVIGQPQIPSDGSCSAAELDECLGISLTRTVDTLVGAHAGAMQDADA